MRSTEIERCEASRLQSVAGNPWRSGAAAAVVVRIPSEGLVIRRARVHGQGDAQIDDPQIAVTDEVETMPTLRVGGPPLRGRVVIACGEPPDAVGVVVHARQRVLCLPREP